MIVLLDFLERLDNIRVPYKLTKVRDAIMVEVAVPGQRWEIEFFNDNHIEVEKFFGDGLVAEINDLNALIDELSK